MGLHADTHIGRKFTELQGWMNQYIAKKIRYSGTYGFRNSSNNKRLIMNFDFLEWWKDSCYAMMKAIHQGFIPKVVLNMMNENGKISRPMGYLYQY
jgi:hypothetical protein